MVHDREYFRRRACEARAAAFAKDEGEAVEVAGHLALAYSALARWPAADGDADADTAAQAALVSD